VSGGTATDVDELRALYLDTMEKILCNSIYRDASFVPNQTAHAPHDPELRNQGMDWPVHAHTMIGFRRLRHLRECVEQVLRDGVPGDLIEAGVWRGGASIMMRAVLAAHGVRDRLVWLADSFRGLPPPNPQRYPHDEGMHFEGFSDLAVSLDVVKANFERYGLLDDRVRFAEGLFAQTLAGIQSDRFAVIRLDGDLYESTLDSLNALYPRLAAGGFAVIDDYGAYPACRAAVDDYRERHGIVESIQEIDWAGAFWRKSHLIGNTTASSGRPAE
jgi:O-methyltransferase